MEEELDDIAEIISDLSNSKRIGEEELAAILELSDRININKHEYE